MIPQARGGEGIADPKGNEGRERKMEVYGIVVEARGGRSPLERRSTS